ncbi:MAG: HD domain-containing protein [FCB group bacterium]|nr:HD domain-containing protein [FCB group bacterium]
MTNIRDLLPPDSPVTERLTLIGQVGRDLEIETYVVGGVVRDLLLGATITDLDIMVVGDGIQFARNLADRMGKNTVVPFPDFGTARIPDKNLEIEIASARTETYDTDSRKPNEIIYTDLTGDLSRRDFTINALAVDLHPERFGDLHDPWNGIADLSRGLLRTPLDPMITFSEDPLRMLRAAYFMAKLNFDLEPSVLLAMRSQASRISIVSGERITAELLKILSTSVPSVGFLILQKSGLLARVFPEIDIMVGLQQPKEWHHKDIFHHTLQVVDNAARLTPKTRIRFAALVHDIAKPQTRRIDPKKGFTFHGHDEVGARMFENIARRMKLSNEYKAYLQKMIRLHLRPIALAKKEVTDSAIRRVMVAAGDDLDDLLILCRADITTKNPHLVTRYLGNFDRVEKKMQDVTERDQLRAFQSPVRGDVIMQECNLREGRLVGKIKKALEEAILDGRVENNYDAVLDYLRTHKKDFLNPEKSDNSLTSPESNSS